MGLPETFSQPFGLKGDFVNEVKRIYARAYAKALDLGAGVLTETAELEAIVDHKVRDFTETQWQQAQKVLDKLNRSLAEQAIPENRRHEMVSRRLEEKAAAVAASKVKEAKSRKNRRTATTAQVTK